MKKPPNNLTFLSFSGKRKANEIDLQLGMVMLWMIVLVPISGQSGMVYCYYGLLLVLSRKLASASWSPSCLNKVLGWDGISNRVKLLSQLPPLHPPSFHKRLDVGSTSPEDTVRRDTPHFRRDTPHSTLYTLRSTLCTLYFTLCILHFALYTWHSTLYSLHFKPHPLHFILQTLPSTFYTLHSALYTPHSTF